MAIHDAIEAAASDWDAIEPYLTPAHLSSIARTMVEVRDLDAVEERLLGILSAIIPSHHRMWIALRLDNNRRARGVGDQVRGRDSRSPAQDIWFRAYSALTSEELAKDAVADAIVESTKRRILGFGYRLVPDEADNALEGLAGAVGIALDNGTAYPAFQFADDDLMEVHHGFRMGTEFLGGNEDPLGALAWWVTPNAWIGRAPAALLGTSRESEILYAAEQLRNDSW